MKAINRYLSGCQYRGRSREGQGIKTGKYGDCLFFKGEPIVVGQVDDPSDDRNYYCLSFDFQESFANDSLHREIYPVERVAGTSSIMNPINHLESSAWVLLRLSENDVIKTQVRQIRIDLNETFIKSGTTLEVFTVLTITEKLVYLFCLRCGFCLMI